jgi:BlaI family penicillinase repressor
MHSKHVRLSRRERQIMDLLYAKSRATAQEVMEGLPDPPGYSAVRALLATLESKGHIRHEKDGAKYVYIPTLKPQLAKRSAIGHLIQTFFNGSRGDAAAALLDVAPSQFSKEELDRLADLIDKARKAGEK